MGAALKSRPHLPGIEKALALNAAHVAARHGADGSRKSVVEAIADALDALETKGTTGARAT
jgi:hypothetical protein